jgi:tRNA (cytidine56-2'-O)-methyltransferase
MPDDSVLRIGHRAGRDERVTTHVGLTARAFGADGIIVSDEKIAETLGKVVEKFGGPFKIKCDPDWKKVVKGWKGTVVHLTMYGENLDAAVGKIPQKGNVLVVVGAEKVPGELYKLATYNVSVGNQPHSEVAALAIFLDRMTREKWKSKKFRGRLRILPNERGKTVVDNSK